ncbi:peptidylprolyl isomerase [Bacillus kwashiorkori]|uniref:peptidylprolyl isomerase n=1 Tax=Bacillus kwashiorkori TaxID=1522318 RepID=UPI0007818503|nr:peptidylprolyl isomerase [Bacillus kwashiorkori]
MRVLNKKSIAAIMLAVLLLLSGCGTKGQDNSTEDKKSGENTMDAVEKNPIVTIEMEDGGKIEMELYPNIAPNTVANFVSLVEEGYYDGVIFHRVIPGFMVQGGDPQGTGMGGPGYQIAGEFSANGFENNLKHERGVVSMARTPDPNSAGSQFFIMVAEATHLDGEYAAFGKVISGMDVVDGIVNVERDANDKPLKDQVMKKVKVNTFGVTYPEVKKVE